MKTSECRIHSDRLFKVLIDVKCLKCHEKNVSVNNFFRQYSFTYNLVTLKETPKGTCRVFEQHRHENSKTTTLITKFHSRTCEKTACQRKWGAVLMEPGTSSSRENSEQGHKKSVDIYVSANWFCFSDDLRRENGYKTHIEPSIVKWAMFFVILRHVL